MPTLARWYIKTALVYLVGALLVGTVMAGARLWHVALPASALWFVYLHLLVVGWLTQLIFGVAYWLFPRRSREQPYGTTWPATAAFVLLNAGLLARAVSEPYAAVAGAPWTAVLTASAFLQWLATVLFAAYLWKRVKVK